LTPVLRALLTVGLVALTLGSAASSIAQPIPAGESAAVLSFIDSAAGRVEVVRHWPWAPADVDVYPFVPYFWAGCPGPGAIMMLVTGAGAGAPILDRLVSALDRLTAPPSGLRGAAEIGRIAATLRSPGDPSQEVVKALVPWISDLATYERRGYVVFLFIHGQGLHCVATLKTVPEGYAIPFVR
jgi:hypothetical protein